MSQANRNPLVLRKNKVTISRLQNGKANLMQGCSLATLQLFLAKRAYSAHVMDVTDLLPHMQ